MKRAAIALAVVILGVALLLLLRDRTPQAAGPQTTERRAQPTTTPAAVESAAQPVVAANPSVAPAPSAVANPPGLQPSWEEPAPAAAPSVVRQSAPPGPPPLVRVESVRTTIRQYGSAFNGNPVGTNAEITAALNGGNPRHAFFLNTGDGNVINANGELIDQWGSPYFFHQLSAKDMEVRSAGPDRIMYTPDDLVVR